MPQTGCIAAVNTAAVLMGSWRYDDPSMLTARQGTIGCVAAVYTAAALMGSCRNTLFIVSSRQGAAGFVVAENAAETPMVSCLHAPRGRSSMVYPHLIVVVAAAVVVVVNCY